MLRQQQPSETRIVDTFSLCSLCQTISVERMRGPSLDQMQPHQPSYLALKLSAESGCQLCAFICTALSNGNGKESAAAFTQVCARYPGREISLVAWGGAGSNFDRIHVITTGDIPDGDESDEEVDDSTMHPEHQIALGGVMEIYTYPDDSAAYHGKVNGRVNGRPLPMTPGNSDEDFALIKQWLSKCCSQHYNCRGLDSETLLPTRVIDVGPPEGSLQPVLIESKDIASPYVTLSHCWGGRVASTTTTKNLDEHMRGIPLYALPKTFIDAVIITRRLDLRYLWIDSLCILQDSAADWQRESASMEAIYRNGYVNISARAASNSTVGCFFERAPEPLACRIPWKCSDCPTQGSIYVRSPERKADSVREMPCDRRGWILQEQLLSPRVLYYGSDQLYWECCETSLRQDGRLDDDALYRFGNFPNLKVALGLSAVAPSTYRVDSRSHSWWALLVEEYTRRSLTFASDKLPAISGVAKAYQNVTGKTYVVGVWQEELPSALAWFKRSREQVGVSDQQPSWSWAKMSGKVSFASVWPRYLEEAACTVVDIRVILNQNLNQFDNVACAEIDLRGHVLDVTYRDVPDAYTGFRGNSVFADDDHPLGQLNADMSDSKWPSTEGLVCILIDTGATANGLLLVPDKTKKGVYQRVGLFRADTRVEDDGRMLVVERFLQSDMRVLTIA